MHALQPYVDDIWWASYGICWFLLLPVYLRSVLFQHFESPEEGTRNVVAECVGKLTLLEPQTLLPRLQVTSNSFSEELIKTFHYRKILSHHLHMFAVPW